MTVRGTVIPLSGADGGGRKKLVRPAVARKAVEHVRVLFGLSQRRACWILNLDRTTVRYVHRRPDDGELRQRLRAIAAERRRFGYRRLGIMLAREGLSVNHKKLLRLYREEGLRVRRRGGRKRAMGMRAPVTVPQGINQRWSLDFVTDALACGRRFRILAVVDDFSRECLALVADTSLSGGRVVRELDAVIEMRGRPLMIISDRQGSGNDPRDRSPRRGTELTSMAILKWAQDRQVEWHYIAPGKPQRDTASSRASTAGCATSASTRRCSRRCHVPARCGRPGGATTTTYGRTAASEG